MTRNALLQVIACALIAAATFAAESAWLKKKPNAMFILAENVGYGDLSPYAKAVLAKEPQIVEAVAGRAIAHGQARSRGRFGPRSKLN
jgi:hypothetical protein